MHLFTEAELNRWHRIRPPPPRVIREPCYRSVVTYSPPRDMFVPALSWEDPGPPPEPPVFRFPLRQLHPVRDSRALEAFMLAGGDEGLRAALCELLRRCKAEAARKLQKKRGLALEHVPHRALTRLIKTKLLRAAAELSDG